MPSVNVEVKAEKQDEKTFVDMMVEASQEELDTAIRADIIHDKLREIQSNSLRKNLEQQNVLIARLNETSKIPNMAEAERQRAIIESDLQQVRAEYAKRQQDVGVLANELFALHDELGLQTKIAKEDTKEDIAKREAAKRAVENAEQRLAEIKIALKTAEAALGETKGAFWPIGKKAKIAEAQLTVKRAEQRIIAAEAEIKTAVENIAVVDEQIEVDKRERVRKASLSENFALIREFTQSTVDILTADIEETNVRAIATEKALNSAVTKKITTARELQEIRDTLQDLRRDLARETDALGEIPDQSSVAYGDQQAIVTKLENQMTDASGTELELNTMHMAMTQAIEANKSLLGGLKMQLHTSKVYLIKLVAAEKTAEVLGRGIDRMIKNSIQETASDALDRVTDNMTFTAVSLGIQAEVASAKSRNDAIERHHTLMEAIVDVRSAGDEGVRIEAERYMVVDAKIREGYKNRGIDLEMSNLAEAAAIFEEEEKKLSIKKTNDKEFGDVVY